MSEPNSPKKCRTQDPAGDPTDAWLLSVADEVDGHVEALRKRGWRLWDLAVKLDCSPRSIISWRNGAAEMPATKLLRLRALVAEELPARKVSSL